MQPGRTTNTGSRTMEVVAAVRRCQLLLIVLMAAMLLLAMKGSLLLARTINLQGSISKEFNRAFCLILALDPAGLASGYSTDRMPLSLTESVRY
ncbi:hypothetical protein STEG23_038255 [Scotinomys teguina]